MGIASLALFTTSINKLVNPVAISLAINPNDTINAPIARGIIVARPNIIISKDFTIATAATDPPMAKASNAANNIATPAPKANTAVPIIVNAKARPNITPITPCNAKAATPITVNAPAKAVNPMANCLTLNMANSFNAGVKALIATDNISSDVAAVRVDPPLDNIFRGMVRDKSAPAKPPIPRPSSSQEYPEKFFTTVATIFKAAPTMVSPTPIEIMFLGINTMETLSDNRAPANPAKPLPSSSQEYPANSNTTPDIIFNAAPTAINPTPTEVMFLVDPVNLTNKVSMVIRAPTPDNPLTMPSQSIRESSSTTPANIFIVVAKAISSNAFPKAFFVFTADIIAIETVSSSITAPTPTNPLAKESQSNADISTNGLVNIFIAIAIPIISTIVDIFTFLVLI